MPAEVDHPLFARFAEFIAAQEGPVEHDRRCEALAGLTGRVIEIGSGSGPNFRHYPDSVSEVVAVEPEAHLRARAVEAARDSGRPIRVVDAVADRRRSRTAPSTPWWRCWCSVPFRRRRPRSRSCTAWCDPA